MEVRLHVCGAKIDFRSSGERDECGCAGRIKGAWEGMGAKAELACVVWVCWDYDEEKVRCWGVGLFGEFG